MKLNKTILATAAIVLPLTIGTGSALAYFTANDRSSGGYRVEVGPPQTDIEETFGDWTKHVVIRNEGEIPVYVRVRAFSGLEDNSNLTYPAPGAGWRDGGDGYYYYDPALEAKGTADNKDRTTTLNIKINNVPAGATDKEAFNVIVVYERTPAVTKDENGNMVPDWNYKIVEQSEFPSGTQNPDENETDTGENAGNQTEEQKGGNEE